MRRILLSLVFIFATSQAWALNPIFGNSAHNQTAAGTSLTMAITTRSGIVADALFVLVANGSATSSTAVAYDSSSFVLVTSVPYTVTNPGEDVWALVPAPLNFTGNVTITAGGTIVAMGATAVEVNNVTQTTTGIVQYVTSSVSAATTFSQSITAMTTNDYMLYGLATGVTPSADASGWTLVVNSILNTTMMRALRKGPTVATTIYNAFTNWGSSATSTGVMLELGVAATSTMTVTQTFTYSPTFTATPTWTPTATPTATPSATPTITPTPPCATCASNTLAFYRLNGNGNDSCNTYNLVPQGTPYFSGSLCGIEAQGLGPDANPNDYYAFSAGFDAAWGPNSGVWTVEGYVYTINTLTCGVECGGSYDEFFYLTDGTDASSAEMDFNQIWTPVQKYQRLEFNFTDSGATTYAIGITATPSTCYDVAMVGNGTFYAVYINNVQVATFTGTLPIISHALNGGSIFGGDAGGLTGSQLNDWRFSPGAARGQFPTFDGGVCTFTSTITPSPTFSVSPTITTTYSFTRSPTFTKSPTYTITPTFTFSPTATPTPSASPSWTASPTFSASPTNSPIASPTPTPNCGSFGQTSPIGFDGVGGAIVFYKAVSFTGIVNFMTVETYILSGQGQYQAALYQDSSGVPWALVGTSAKVYATAGWQAATLSLGGYQNPGTYWLAVQVSNTLKVQYSPFGFDRFQYTQFGVWKNPATIQSYIGNASIYTTACHY